MLTKLEAYLKELSAAGVALAFSGGVDSALLLAVLQKVYQQAPFNLKVLTAATVLQDPAETRAAEQKLQQSGVPYEVLRFNPLEIEQVRLNRPDRCYWCKKNIFLLFRKNADAAGIKCLLDGTNADDLKTYRPGLKALKELDVVSPLATLGINKAAVREMSKKLGLDTANKPSVPCMATRFAYNTTLEPEKISQVAAGEEIIKKACPQIRNLRLRADNNTARIEIDAADFALLLPKREELITNLKSIGFARVTLDLQGFRSGSQDERLTTNKNGENNAEFEK